ncbi:MAG TPA: CerR family C-terminal domain-containing protein [Steroidobacteraceae bacterium]|jgi:AcrR family transcriptional regulator
MSRRTEKKPIDHRLLDTAIDYFGRQGLEGASTRAIAAGAKTAMSSITYHYGGKEGLYAACARHIAQQIHERMEQVMAAARPTSQLTPAAAIEEILAMIDSFLQVMLNPESAPWARFIVREQMDPTDAFRILWEEVFSPMTGRLISLVRCASDGRRDEGQVRIHAATLIGQVLFFRVARETALRMMDWEDIDARRAGEIRRAIHANVHALLAPHEAGAK